MITAKNLAYGSFVKSISERLPELLVVVAFTNLSIIGDVVVAFVRADKEVSHLTVKSGNGSRE